MGRGVTTCSSSTIAFKCSSGFEAAQKRPMKLTASGCSSMGVYAAGQSDDGPMGDCCNKRTACFQTCGMSKSACDKAFDACAASACDKSISKAIAGAKTTRETGAISFAKCPTEKGRSQLRGAELLINSEVFQRCYDSSL